MSAWSSISVTSRSLSICYAKKMYSCQPTRAHGRNCVFISHSRYPQNILHTLYSLLSRYLAYLIKQQARRCLLTNWPIKIPQPSTATEPESIVLLRIFTGKNTKYHIDQTKSSNSNNNCQQTVFYVIFGEFTLRI